MKWRILFRIGSIRVTFIGGEKNEFHLVWRRG